MSTIRWGIAAAIGAFFISLFLGIIAGNQALRTILTALIFGLTFFGIGLGVRIMINNFFPELLFMDNQAETDDSYEADTSSSNISLDNSGDFAVPEMYKIPGQTPELGNIEDLINGSHLPYQEGIDDKPEEGYNDLELSIFDKPEEKPAPAQTNIFTPSFGNDEGLGGLPDLDVMAMAFSASGGEEPREAQAPLVSSGSDDFFFGSIQPSAPSKQEEMLPDRSQYKGNKPQSLDGDFDPKEIAQGIRTVLNKDNK